MGIERFFSTLNSLTDIWETIKFPPKDKKRLSHFFIDFNSIIHTQSAKLLNRKITNNIQEFEKLLLENIERYLFELLEQFFDTKEFEFFMIAIDGTPSLAKIKEQQKRRYFGEILNLQLSDLKDDKFTWDKNNISPTTRFMFSLNKLLNSKVFLNKLKKKFPSLKNILISDSTNFGEGEMKILNFLRKMNFKTSDNLVIYSPDSDMVLLNLLVKPNFKLSLLRYDQNASTSEEDLYNWLDMTNLRNYLYDYASKILNKQIDEVNLINDIIFIFTFFGNDFLPKINSINPRYDFFLMIDYYLINLIKNDYITKKYSINYPSLKSFLIGLSKIEDNLIHLANKRNRFTNYDMVNFNNFPLILSEIKTKLSYPTFDLKDLIDNKTYQKFKNNFFNIEKGFGYVMLRVLKKIELTNYIKELGLFESLIKKYDSLFIYFISQDLLFDLIVLFYNKFNDFPFYSTKSYLRKMNDRKLQYRKRSFSSKEEPHLRRLKGMNDYEREKYLLDNYLDEYYNYLNPIKDKSTINKKHLVNEYLIGIDWIYQYYFHNKINPIWYYPENESPSISEILQYFTIPKITPKSFYITPLEHIILITPIRYNDLEYSFQYMKGLFNDKTFNKILSFFKKDKTLPDITEIHQRIFKKKEKLIDCSVSIFISKCHLIPINEINHLKFIANFRKHVSIENQLKKIEK